MGSIGVGCTLDRGVRADVRSAKITKIFFNDHLIHFPTIEYALSSLTKKSLIVTLQSPLPLGYGFGLSSASTLATVFATNKLFNLELDTLDLIKLVHIAEVKTKTGLGSVATQIIGGFLIKTIPGIPSQFLKLPFLGKKLYAIIVKKLETPSILNDKNKMRSINKAADDALRKISRLPSPSLAEILDIAYAFAQKSELLTNRVVISLIKKIKNTGGHATMAMLGEVVISNIKPDFPVNFQVEELTITDKRVSLL